MNQIDINIPDTADKILNGQGAKEFFKALIKNPIAVICFVLIGVVVFFGLIANAIMFYGYHNQGLSMQDQSKTQIEQVIINREVLTLNKEMLGAIRDLGFKIDKNTNQIEYQNQILDKLYISLNEKEPFRRKFR